MTETLLFEIIVWKIATIYLILYGDHELQYFVAVIMTAWSLWSAAVTCPAQSYCDDTSTLRTLSFIPAVFRPTVHDEG